MYCSIINPEYIPGFTVKKIGNPRFPDIKLKVLRSEIFPNSEMDNFKKSIDNESG